MMSIKERYFSPLNDFSLEGLVPEDNFSFMESREVIAMTSGQKKRLLKAKIAVALQKMSWAGD